MVPKKRGGEGLQIFVAGLAGNGWKKSVLQLLLLEQKEVEQLLFIIMLHELEFIL